MATMKRRSIRLQLVGVSLDFPVEIQGSEDRLQHGLLSLFSFTRRAHTRVLSNISFDLNEGGRLGVLGLNGSGKTSLLRVLNGGLLPKAGRVERVGTLQSLLSISLGFLEDATLAENIILRGTAMGLRYRQMERDIESILRFSGLLDRANHRLSTLSAGQRMRLGFSISTRVQPDILIMDEWLGAGDAAFLERAKDRMLDRFHNSKIVVIATHSPQLVRDLCNRVLVLDKGKVWFDGGVEEGLAAYARLVKNSQDASAAQARHEDPLLFGDALGMVEQILCDGAGVVIEGWAVIAQGQPVPNVKVLINGVEIPHEGIHRVDRSDVRWHLGKRKGDFGFRVRVPMSLGSLVVASSIEVVPMVKAEMEGVPLRVAPGAVIQGDGM